MVLSFIGKAISLISHSDIRYRGILAGIDAAASTIQLSNVICLGTEDRRPLDGFIPPNQEPYKYIVFRASEVKDLKVDESLPQDVNQLRHDPAIAEVGAMGSTSGQVNAQPAALRQDPSPIRPGGPSIAPHSQQQEPAPRAAAKQPGNIRGRANPALVGNRNRRNDALATSLEKIERALDDLNVSHTTRNGHTTSSGVAHPVGGGRRGRRGSAERTINVPNTDFDFASSNAKFNKGALTPGETVTDTASPIGSSMGDEGVKERVSAYNREKSFFDSLSSSAAAAAAEHPNGEGRGRRGGGAGRLRREEESRRNIATFGETGESVGGLGHGRRVGRRGRGGGRGRRQGAENQGSAGQTAPTRL